MPDPNEPRLMKPRREEKRVTDMATGDAGRDGYTRIARRQVPNESFGIDGIQPQVGERDWNRGPRFSEDY